MLQPPAHPMPPRFPPRRRRPPRGWCVPAWTAGVCRVRPRAGTRAYAGGWRPGRLRCAGRGSASLGHDSMRSDLLSARPSAPGHDERRPSWPCPCPATPTSSTCDAMPVGCSAASGPPTRRSGPRGATPPRGAAGRDGVVLAVRRAARRGARLRLRELAAAARPTCAAAADLGRDPAALDPRLALTGRGEAPAESASVAAALACLTYTDRDEPARWARAAALLAADPDLADARRRSWRRSPGTPRPCAPTSTADPGRRDARRRAVPVVAAALPRLLACAAA